MGDLGQILPLKYDPRNLESIHRAVAHSNVVINLIGNQRPTLNYSLDDTNRKIARLIARVAKVSIHLFFVGDNIYLLFFTFVGTKCSLLLTCFGHSSRLELSF